MKAPLVSVIIPAFNPGKFLDEAVDSILQQTYQRLEVIVVDDGSSPPCTSYSRTAAHVTTYYQQNAGPAHARNSGVALSKGELIAFHDADDLWDKEKIERQVSVLQEKPSIGVVLSLISNFIEPGTSVPAWFVDESKLESRAGFVSTALIRRKCFEYVGNFDVRYRVCEDIEWLIRMRDLGIESTILPEVLYRRRIHDSNSSADIELAHVNRMQILRESLRRRKALLEGS